MKFIEKRVYNIKLTRKQFLLLQQQIWVIQNQDETSQNEESEDFDLDYTKTMNEIYKKLELRYTPKYVEASNE